jgi:hypothetical protein
MKSFINAKFLVINSSGQILKIIKTVAGVNNTIGLQNLSITIYFIKQFSILKAKTHRIIIKKISIFNLSRLRKS